jgi:hypothetical protein
MMRRLVSIVISMPPRLTEYAFNSGLESVRRGRPSQGPRVPCSPSFVAAAGAVGALLCRWLEPVSICGD